MIKQEELEKFKNAQEKLSVKKKKLELVAAALKDLENSLVSRLHEGERMEKGVLLATVESKPGRASIKWKEEVAKLKGKAYVEWMLQKAKRTTLYWLRVVEK